MKDFDLAKLYSDGRDEYLKEHSLDNTGELGNAHIAGLKKVYDFGKSGYKNVVDSFRDKHFFLSNFYLKTFTYKNMEWDCAEQAYQCMKTDNKDDWNILRREKSPGKIKRMGKLVSLKKDWENIKLTVMKEILVEKFNDQELRQKLLDTGDAELIEGNTWGDKYWGVCDGEGENHLGKILMEIRSEFKCA